MVKYLKRKLLSRVEAIELVARWENIQFGGIDQADGVRNFYA